MVRLGDEAVSTRPRGIAMRLVRALHRLWFEMDLLNHRFVDEQAKRWCRERLAIEMLNAVSVHCS
jgi:hypothetical protein